MSDMYEIEGVSVPRVFVSARDGLGLAQLREVLAQQAMTRLPVADKTMQPEPEEFAGHAAAAP